MNPFRPDIQRIEGYTPGEQPQEPGWIKLNTNENPYPPSPRVAAAIAAAAGGRLNIYPDPLVRSFRRAAAEQLGLDEEWILPANGSDENLTIIMRSFVDAGEQVAYPYPSYVLYETLAELQGAGHRRMVLNEDWSWPETGVDAIAEASKVVFVPNPNSPSGNLWDHETIARLVPPRGVLVLDEAYGDFCDRPHRGELLQSAAGARVIVTRTLSKSYSLAGIRFGFAIAHPDLIAGMRKVKDSYNCNTLSIAAATAAIQDQGWMRTNTARIRATRTRLTRALREHGFDVVDSQANFVWATHPDHDHAAIYEGLKARKVLVRYMRFPIAAADVPAVDAADTERSGLRISIGTDDEINGFLEHLQAVLAES